MSGPTPNQDIFDVRRIRRLVELMKEHDLSEIDIREGETRIQLRRGCRSGGQRSPRRVPPRPRRPLPAAAQRRPSSGRADDAHVAVIKSPMVGTFYTAPNPDSPALRESGRPRRPGDDRLHRRGDEGLQPDSGGSVGQDRGRAGRERRAGRVRSTAVQSRYAGLMFKRILVANRGEIALRIFRACRELGIETVAIFSEADRGAAYLELADEAYCIGPPKAGDSYLKIDRVISAAEIGNVQAIHPGYGFLAENAHFAEVCRELRDRRSSARRPEAMAMLGDKNAARKLAREANVPTVPGSEGLIESEAQAVAVGPADRLSGADQGVGRRRRTRHARGA